LTEKQQDDLLLYTKKFASVYKESSSNSIKIKMHLLLAHLELHLLKYGTVSLFAEDSMESIHALLNKLRREYASLDGERKTKCIIKLIAASNVN
jgi:hypothetical protein